jgi:hypothetical protein
MLILGSGWVGFKRQCGLHVMSWLRLGVTRQSSTWQWIHWVLKRCAHLAHFSPSVQSQAMQDQGPDQGRLLTLPDELLCSILHQPCLKHRNSIAAASKVARDAVLKSSTTVRLDVSRGVEAAPLSAELLDHACQLARPGLTLEVRAGARNEPSPEVTNTLLQPRLSKGGWTNVHHLTVRQQLKLWEACSCSCMPASL